MHAAKAARFSCPPCVFKEQEAAGNARAATDRMEDIIRYEKALGSNQLFADMSREEMKNAVRLLCGKVENFPKGTLVHRPWTALSRFGLVLSGSVQACCDDFDGNRMIMALVQPGVTFGESLCFLKIPDSPVYIYASEDSALLWLSAENLYNGSAEAPVLAMQARFTALLAARTLAMNSRIQTLSKISLREKLMVYFSQQAAAAGSTRFRIPLNREDMATYIGANRASLSRELSKMKREGVIDYDKNDFTLLRHTHL